MVRERGLDPRLVLFTSSDRVNDLPQGVVAVGKGWMVSQMQVLLQGQRLHLPRTVEAGILATELMDYEITVNDHANASFNAKSGSHDDLVIALGLSCGIERSAGRASSRRYTDRVPTHEEDIRPAGPATAGGALGRFKCPQCGRILCSVKTGGTLKVI